MVYTNSFLIISCLQKSTKQKSFELYCLYIMSLPTAAVFPNYMCSIVVLEWVRGQRDVTACVGAAFALGLLVTKVLAANGAQHLVGLGPISLFTKLVHIYNTRNESATTSTLSFQHNILHELSARPSFTWLFHTAESTRLKASPGVRGVPAFFLAAEELGVFDAFYKWALKKRR